MRVLAAAALALMLGACQAGGPAGASPSGAKRPLPPAPPPPTVEEDRLVCPADVKQCPDGSFVSRNPAAGCAFNPCPAPARQ